MVLFGWKACPEQYAPVELMEYALQASKAGFDIINTSDHFHPWSDAGQSSFTWSWLGALAGQAPDSILSTGVICPTMRYHPALIAQAAATISHFASRGFWLGVGTGEAISEFPVLSLWPHYAERRERLAEAIPLIRALFRGERVSFQGKYYQTSKAQLYTPPASSIPIIVAAHVPQSAAFAGTYGDGLYTMGGNMGNKSSELYPLLIERFEESARLAHKDPSNMPRIVELIVGYTDDIEAAVQNRLTYFAATYTPAQDSPLSLAEHEHEQQARIAMVKKTGCFSRDPEDHVAFAQSYIDAGFNCLIFHYAGPDQPTFIEKYARDVLTRLRSRNNDVKRNQL